MIVLGGFLIVIGTISSLAYGGDVGEEGAFGRNARLQVAVARAALVVGVLLLLLGLATAALT